MEYEKEFRKAYPETIGETERAFDLHNYSEFLESRIKALEGGIREIKHSVTFGCHEDVLEKCEQLLTHTSEVKE